jgi:predicted aspartyl protease
LGYDTQSKEKKRITTASGIEYVDEVTLDKIIFAGMELANVTAYAHTFPEESFTKGVIGMNVLSDFDLFASFQREILKLSYPA